MEQKKKRLTAGVKEQIKYDVNVKGVSVYEMAKKYNRSEIEIRKICGLL